jgi:hypothetical protein
LSGVIAKGDASRGKRCFAPVPLEESHADGLLKSPYLEA